MSSETWPGIDLLWQAGPCLVVNKPCGLLTQAVAGVDSLEARIKAAVKGQLGKTHGDVYLGVPHRLDRPASGALVLARHVRAARRLAEQFEDRMVRKTYWALVEGHIAEEAGVWRDFMRKVPGEPRAELVERTHPDARLAVLRYRVAGRFAETTWLEIELDTGRTHQIRLQTACRGWPIVGDHQYGSTRVFGPEVSELRDRWIALHARSLAFRHPMTQSPVEVLAPPPAVWQDWGIPDS